MTYEVGRPGPYAATAWLHAAERRLVFFAQNGETEDAQAHQAATAALRAQAAGGLRAAVATSPASP